MQSTTIKINALEFMNASLLHSDHRHVSATHVAFFGVAIWVAKTCRGLLFNKITLLNSGAFFGLLKKFYLLRECLGGGGNC
jgi:hypothetical protein